MSFLPRIALSFAGRFAAKRFDEATHDPVRAQHRKLLSIVGKNRGTEYGRKHGFDRVSDLESWQRLVPVVDYEAIREVVERTARGEENLLTARKPIMFAQTSGTTGKPKLIPVTPSCLGRDHGDQMLTWLFQASRVHPRMFQGKILSLVSPAVEGYTPSGLPFGSTSGHIYRHLPWLVRSGYAIPYEVFEVSDHATKYYLILRLGLSADVTFLCTANPSSLLKLCEIGERRADELLRDLADGTIQKKGLRLEAAEEGLRAELESGLRPEPEKARQLERARNRRGGRLAPVDYWPNLALIGCWKGGTVGNSIPQLDQWFFPEGEREVPIRDWGYLSSEARGSVPLWDEGSGGVLTVATNVYEFVEAQELERSPEDPEAWRFLGVGDIRRGEEYYVFVTTSGGLYRYDMNDVIRVVDFYNRTPVIEFIRKGRGMTSLTGEKVSVDQILAAFEGASRELGLYPRHFKAEADEKDCRYVFKVECEQEPAESTRKDFLETVERCLCAENIEYESKRKSLRLRSPVLFLMRPGWYERLQRKDLRDFQRKSIKLSERCEERQQDVMDVVCMEEKSDD